MLTQPIGKLMKLERILLLIAAGIIAVLLFLNVQDRDSVEAYRIEKEQAEAKFKRDLKRLDSEVLKEREYRRSLEAENLTLQRLSKKSDSTAIVWKKRFINEKKKKFGHFTDAGYDSLISGLYPD
jgi:hypothetical protein